MCAREMRWLQHHTIGKERLTGCMLALCWHLAQTITYHSAAAGANELLHVAQPYRTEIHNSSTG